MSQSQDGGVLFRVVRGSPGADELAALTVVLLSLRGGDEEPGGARPLAGSLWWRGTDAYRAPRSWQ